MQAYYIAPRLRRRSGRLYWGRPAGEFHAAARPDGGLLIHGRIGGSDFRREFREGDRAAYAPDDDLEPGVVADIEPTRIVILDTQSFERRRIDLYQFIRMNWRRGRVPAGGTP